VKRIFAILMVCLFMVAVMAVTASTAFAQGGSDTGGAKKGPHFVACENTGNGAGGCPSNR
jgi:hypothetical protein